MNKIVHLGLFLAIVSAVAGGALAFANQMRTPMILNWSMQHWILKRFKRFMNIKTFISST